MKRDGTFCLAAFLGVRMLVPSLIQLSDKEGRRNHCRSIKYNHSCVWYKFTHDVNSRISILIYTKLSNREWV